MKSYSAMASVDIQEKANFTRLSRLLVDKGTEALRNTFDGIHPPSNLPAVLTANRISLLKLKPRVINDSQWDLLYPPSGNPPDSKTFDVTLLTVLFRNICGLPKTGWGATPLDTDRSLQANIVRMKLFRNAVYAHVTSTQVDNATFESLWKKITQALIELNIPQNDVDELKTCPLAPEEETYLATLKDWKLQEENLTNYVQSINRNVTRLTQITEEKNRTKETDDDFLRKLAKHNFGGKIRSKAKLFLLGTRKWLLKKVDGWFFENECESKILLLTAGPGFGKSVFAAKVCEDFKKKGKLAACHFCDFNDSNLRNPMMMLQSLASQMCENVVGFKEKLLDQLKRPHEVRSVKDAFGIYLQNPLDELEMEEPGLVVIDGLDESAADNKHEIVNLIVDYFPDLPECIKVLVTSRPTISLAKLSDLEKMHFEMDDEHNNLDLERYLKASLPHLKKEDTISSVTPVMMYRQLARKCEGSFPYAFHAQSELRKRNDLDKMTSEEIIDFLPKGLDSLYQVYFRRLEAELKAIVDENLDVLKVLEMVVASQGPLPLNFVTNALGLSPDSHETQSIISKVNETVSCVLYVFDGLVIVFHKSVIDWLEARGYQNHKYTVKVSDGNMSLWLKCEQIFKEIKENVCSGGELKLTDGEMYALGHGFEHLITCNMKKIFFWFVDVVIIHVLLTIFSPSCGDHMIVTSILDIWFKILEGAVEISNELRAQLSWNHIEINFMPNYVPGRRVPLLWDSHFYYLQSVLTHSPKGYLSDNDEKMVDSLLSSVPKFVEFNSHEVDVIPLAVRRLPSVSEISTVGVSHDKTMAAVAEKNGRILVIRVENLVELWQFSSEYKNISCCTFAPDDSFVLFGKLETALNIAQRKKVLFFRKNKETFVSCAFSPKGKRLITCDGSSTIKLWDVAKQCLLSILCGGVPINSCFFSSTGLFIVACWKRGNSIIEDWESDSSSLIEKWESDANVSNVDSWDTDSTDSNRRRILSMEEREGFSLKLRFPSIIARKYRWLSLNASEARFPPPVTTVDSFSFSIASEDRSLSLVASEDRFSFPIASEDRSLSLVASDDRFSFPISSEDRFSSSIAWEDRFSFPIASEDRSSSDLPSEGRFSSYIRRRKRFSSSIALLDRSLSLIASEDRFSVPIPSVDSLSSSNASDDPLSSPIASDDRLSSPIVSEDRPSSHPISENLELSAENSFCLWNAITLQRSDDRALPKLNVRQGKVLKSKLCKRCFRPGLEKLSSLKSLEIETRMLSKSSDIPCKSWSTEIYNGMQCIFALGEQSLSVIENTHFITHAAWNVFVDVPYNLFNRTSNKKMTAIENNMWLYSDVEKLIVFKTLAPTQKQYSSVPYPTRVLWSSFSPNGYQLATCTSDCCINIWNVNTRQVEQRFKSNQDEPFACWWSKQFLFVLFGSCDRISSLSKYLVDANLKILFYQSQQVSLCHLLDEVVCLSAVVDFTEGFLIFESRKTKSVKLLDFNGVREPRMVILPEREPEMSVTVSSGACFIFGSGGSEVKYHIWKKNTEEAGVYKVFFTNRDKQFSYECVCCFSSDSEVAVVLHLKFEIVDLDLGGHKIVSFDRSNMHFKLFCLHEDRIVITASRQFIQFFDMDSGALLESSFQRCLTTDIVTQAKLSPDDATLAFPNINGDMEFLRLSIPANPLLSSIKQKAATEWDDVRKEFDL